MEPLYGKNGQNSFRTYGGFNFRYKKRFSQLWKNDCIWVPQGFAHGNFFIEDSKIEYMCSGEYNSNCESGISPLAKDINWSLCDKKLKNKFDRISNLTKLITDKDKDGFSLEKWSNDERSNNFIYEKLKEKSYRLVENQK